MILCSLSFLFMQLLRHVIMAVLGLWVAQTITPVDQSSVILVRGGLSVVLGLIIMMQQSLALWLDSIMTVSMGYSVIKFGENVVRHTCSNSTKITSNVFLNQKRFLSVIAILHVYYRRKAK